MNERCEVEWLPPPELDTGQARLNYYHRPERLLRPDDQLSTPSTDPADTPDQDTASDAEPADEDQVVDDEGHAVAPGDDNEIADEVANPHSNAEPADDNQVTEAESGAAVSTAGSSEPGGPAPPGDQAA
ncbi:hypothetical protein A5790_13640 [Mycobacterium sp. 852002-51152_SCH6134967]|nr:hypothetical protein A5790_13640 [Mycobacterium sp. 852002-51152_SCH6134967]